MIKKYRLWAKKYKKDQEGATALEFAILAVPFFALLFSIVELAIVFFISSTLTYAMNEAARDVRTGEFQSSCGGAAEFKTAVCNKMGSLGNCNNLRIDVVSSPSGQFQPELLPPPPTIEDPANPGNPIKPPDTYAQTQARAVVVVRAQYYHKLSFPGQFTRLSNQPGNNRLLTSSTAFRNEPFPAGACP